MFVRDIFKKTGRNCFYITPRLMCLLTFPPYFRCVDIHDMTFVEMANNIW